MCNHILECGQWTLNVKMINIFQIYNYWDLRKNQPGVQYHKVYLHCRKESVHIPALQTLLLARSPVFAAMFTGDLAEKNRPVIHIDDVEPHSFKEMLR